MDFARGLPLPSGAAKFYYQLMCGRSDTNISFRKLRNLLRNLGFEEGVKGSHHVFRRQGLSRPLNLQPANGGKCKPYEVQQVRKVLEAVLSADTKLEAA